VRKVFLHLHFFYIERTVCAQLEARKEFNYNKPWLSRNCRSRAKFTRDRLEAFENRSSDTI